MGPGPTHTPDRRGRRRTVAAVLAGSVLAGGVAAAVVGWWRTTVDAALDRPLVVTSEDRTWELTPRDLDARADAGDALRSLLGDSPAGGSTHPDLRHVPLHPSDEALTAWVADAADDVDLAPRSADLEAPAVGTYGGWRVVPARAGEEVDRAAARERLAEALRTGATEVALPVDEVAPEVPTGAAERAVPIVRDALRTALDRLLTLRHGDDAWETTPRRLGAEPDLGRAVDTALATATDADASPASADDVRVELTAARDAAASLVDEVADEIDRPRRDADVDVDALEVVTARSGLELDRGAATQAVLDAVAHDRARVGLPVEEEPPRVATNVAERALPAIRAALDEPVTVTHDDRDWQVAPRELDATVDVDRVLAAAEDGEPAPADVPVQVDEAAVAATVDAIAGEVDRRPRDGGADWSSGWLQVVEPRDGRSVDRAAATGELLAALEGDAGSVELPVDVVAATAGDVPARALLLRQDERRLYLYVDGEIARSWPVAIGRPSNPTPTGEFTVGAKRHRPSWTNPSPDGWGADMPRRVEPGPDNPLGVRALNWNRGGHDTLIRFHGTPEVHSIGQAASRGCVRLTNDDVRELYDLVPTGTPIVSVSG